MLSQTYSSVFHILSAQSGNDSYLYTGIVLPEIIQAYVFQTTWEIGTTWELRKATPVPRPIQDIEIDLKNKTTSTDFRTVFHSPLDVPNSQVPLY